VLQINNYRNELVSNAVYSELIDTEQNLLAEVRTADARVFFDGTTSNDE